MMSDYKEMTLAQFADAARASNPELGAIDNMLVDYNTGKTVAQFTSREGDGKDTALFLASAREIVLELVRRNIELQEAAKPIAIMSDLLDMKHKPDDEIVSVGVWTEPVPGWVSQFDAWLKLSALDFRKLARLVINRTEIEGMMSEKRKYKVKKCSVCDYDFSGQMTTEEVICPRCHTRYDLVNRKTDHTQTLVAPYDCNHRRIRLICGMESDMSRYYVRMCTDCGEIHVSGTQNGQHYHIEFTIDGDETLAAVGKFAKLIAMDEP